MSFRSQKLLASADGRPCVICGATGSTVAAHVNSVALGKGMGIKAPDYYHARLCQACHDSYDGRRGTLTKREKEDLWMTAFLRTVKQWFDEQIVVVK